MLAITFSLLPSAFRLFSVILDSVFCLWFHSCFHNSTHNTVYHATHYKTLLASFLFFLLLHFNHLCSWSGVSAYWRTFLPFLFLSFLWWLFMSWGQSFKHVIPQVLLLLRDRRQCPVALTWIRTTQKLLSSSNSIHSSYFNTINVDGQIDD